MSQTVRPPTPRPANPRARLRRRLLVAGVVPSLVALAFAVEVLVTLDHDGDGRELWSAEVFTDARGEFAANGGQLNLFERWVSPFDEGTAAFGQTRYEEALGLFEDALELVPPESECVVRIDLALTHEALGDAAAEAGDGEAAAESWQAGVDALTDGECSTDAGDEQRTEDSTTTEERLRAKLEQQEQQQRPDQGDQQGGQGGPDGQQPPPQSPQEEELERRNDEGEQDRENNRDLEDYPGFGDDYEW